MILANGVISREAFAGNAGADELAGAAAETSQLGLASEEQVKQQDKRAWLIQERLLAAALLAVAAGRPEANGSGGPGEGGPMGLDDCEEALEAADPQERDHRGTAVRGLALRVALLWP